MLLTAKDQLTHLDHIACMVLNQKRLGMTIIGHQPSDA
jgi:hypothetical protein